MQTALVQWVSQVKKQWALIMTRITGEQYKIPKVAHLIWLCPHINTFAMTKQKWQGFSTSSSLLCFFYLVLQAPGKQINRWMQKADGRRHIERRYSMDKIQKRNVLTFEEIYSMRHQIIHTIDPLHGWGIPSKSQHQILFSIQSFPW